ncbi:hypothetical protein VB715_07990 [Crocosphaera sp. UHCC 0190]|nr:hypothetical protein [Crocosphaera sp. UHCC 0190]MEA5509702.1 hypothetical protein [Crocosphaera sp. UHCC 0190]
MINTDEGYQETSQSQLLSELDLNKLAEYIDPAEEPQMVRAYRQAINS